MEMETENIHDFEYDDIEKQESIEIPRDERKLITQSYDKSVSDLVRMMEDKELLLDPDYQRNYVWDNKKLSKLIESIILNVPIPVIYVSEESDCKWSVIDGLQRLNSLKQFFGGKVKLSGLEVLHELNNLDYKSLPPKALRLLRNGLIRIVMITADSNDDIKYDIFMRLNTGAIHLNEQELRNCLYRGELISLLHEVAGNIKWLELLGLKQPHKRMTDRELLLRFLALSHNWSKEDNIVREYKGNMKSFLNSFMKTFQNDKEKCRYFKVLCEETIDKVYSVYGKNAFRRIDSTGGVSPINRAMMDAVMISVIPYPKDRLIANKEVITKKLSDELQYQIEEDGSSTSTRFRQSTMTSTSDAKVLNERISIWCNVIDNVLKND